MKNVKWKAPQHAAMNRNGEEFGGASEGESVPDIQDRTFRFALRIIKLCRKLDDGPRVGWTISKQLIRSGTSIGANMEEASAGYSKPDFIHKVGVSLKEARETKYWLKLLAASALVEPGKLDAIQKEADEIARILGAIIMSAKRNPQARGARKV